MANSTSSIQPKGRERSTYIPGLDGIRAIAFLMVFFAHATPGRISTFIPATLGVTIFFFLSGYLITTLLRAELLRTGTISLRDFYIRRTLRIFVPLYVAYTLSALFARVVLHETPGNLLGFLSMLFYFFNYANVLRLPAVLPHGLSVIWSLAVEEHFYLLFPLLYLSLYARRLGRESQVRVLLALCALALCWRSVVFFVFHNPGSWTYFSTDCRFDSILWGSILAIRNNPRFEDPPLLSERFKLPSFVFGLALIAGTLLIQSIAFRESLRYTLQAIGLYLVFNFVLTTISHPAVRWLELVPLRFLGWISYSLYLIHVFILDIFQDRYPGRLWISVPIGLALSLIYGVAMRYTIELPLQALRARFRHVPEADPTAPDAHGLIS